MSKVRLSAVALSAGKTFFKPVYNLQISSPIYVIVLPGSLSVRRSELMLTAILYTSYTVYISVYRGERLVSN